MNDQDYSKREIDSHFEQIKDVLRVQDEVLNDIKIETKKTNGRVTEIERWRYMQMGALTVLTTIILPILAWALWELVNIEDKVDGAVKEAFQEVTGSS